MEHTNDISLQSKNAAELYCSGNKEFLEKYDTEDKQIDYYTELAMKLYDEFEIDGTYTNEGVRKNVAVWFENKKAQMELFRKHPYWSEEAKAIVFLQTETRGIDYLAAADKLYRLEDYVWSKININSNKWIVCIVRDALISVANHKQEQNGLVTEFFIEKFSHFLGSREIPKSVKKMLRCGTKITRLVRKCFEEVVDVNDKIVNTTTLVDEEDDHRTRKSFDKYYAQFADCLSELEVKKITVVSLNFLDFMTMSNGNSWSSCHFINSNGIFHEDSESSYRGLYKQGCLSYALDKPSFILYTLPETFKGADYYRCQKLTRMCCQYEDGILITGKCYPNNNDALITRYRQMMQLIISQVDGIPNLWTFSKKIKKISAFVDTALNAGHYCDYLYDQQKPTISLRKHINIDMDASMMIGHAAYCLHCGEELDGERHDWLQCGKHRETKRCYCCGKRIKDGEEYHVFFGDYYCSDCTFYCEYHKRYEPKDDKYGTITMASGEKVVCKDTLRSVKQCVDCGVYYDKNDMTEGHCPNCITHYDVCSLCGKVGEKDEFAEIDGHKYCKSCEEFARGNIKLITDVADYNVGDYVLMKNDIRCCDFGYSDEMILSYPGKIVKITEKRHGAFYVSRIDSTIWTWKWSANCFAGIIQNGSDELIGRTFSTITTED